MTGAISAPPTSLSFRHWGVNSSDFTLGMFVDLEIFAQNLLTELFYFRKAWSRQKGQGQYVQSMYFLGVLLIRIEKCFFYSFVNLSWRWLSFCSPNCKWAALNVSAFLLSFGPHSLKNVKHFFRNTNCETLLYLQTQYFNLWVATEVSRLMADFCAPHCL